MTHSAKQQNQKKLFHSTRLYKKRIRKDFSITVAGNERLPKIIKSNLLATNKQNGT